MSKPANIGWDDWVTFIARFLADFAKHAYIFVIVGVVVLLVCATSPSLKKKMRYLLGTMAVLLIVALITYFSLTAHRLFVLTLLGSEDDGLAENVYRTFSRVTDQHELVKIVNDRHEDDNVRFYAACAFADQTATNHLKGDSTLWRAFQSAPEIHPRFFNQNNINQIVFPSTVSISPDDVLRRRTAARAAPPSLIH